MVKQLISYNNVQRYEIQILKTQFPNIICTYLLYYCIYIPDKMKT